TATHGPGDAFRRFERVALLALELALLRGSPLERPPLEDRDLVCRAVRARARHLPDRASIRDRITLEDPVAARLAEAIRLATKHCVVIVLYPRPFVVGWLVHCREPNRLAVPRRYRHVVYMGLDRDDGDRGFVGSPAHQCEDSGIGAAFAG